MFRDCICFCVANSKRGPQESLTPCLAGSMVSLDNCGRAGLQAVVLRRHAATHPAPAQTLSDLHIHKEKSLKKGGGVRETETDRDRGRNEGKSCSP